MKIKLDVRDKGQTILSWNARSLLNQIQENDCIPIMASPDFIGVTKPWLNDQIDNDLINISDYTIHRSDHTRNSEKFTEGGLVWYY